MKRYMVVLEIRSSIELTVYNTGKLVRDVVEKEMSRELGDRIFEGVSLVGVWDDEKLDRILSRA